MASSVAPVAAWLTGMSTGRILLLTFVCVLSGLALLTAWRKQATGILSWDGQHWFWSAYPQPLQAISVQFDFQTSLWVYVQRHDGKRTGIWMDQDPRDPGSWRALRRALVGLSGVPTKVPSREGRWVV